MNPPANPNPMTYNAADQLTSWPGMYSYTYDNAGNLKYVKNPAGTSTLKSFTYTPDGLMSIATYNGRTLSNTWDADGNRVRLSANGSEYDFVYDTTAGIPAVIEETNPNGNVYYVREPDGELIARVSGSNTSYYHYDALGSTRLLTNVSGIVTDRYAYDAYGSLLAHDRYTGSVDQPYQFVGKYGYYTHWQEPEFGLLQLGVRFYDTETSRFTQNDRIINEQVSSFFYSNANPNISIDPTGLYIEVCRWNAPRVHQFICTTEGGVTKCAGFALNKTILPGVGKGCVRNDIKDYHDIHKKANAGQGQCYKLTNLTSKQKSCMARRIENDIKKKPCHFYDLFLYNCRSWSADVLEDCTGINLMPWDDDNPGYWNKWLKKYNSN